MVSNPMTVSDFVGRFYAADWKLLPKDQSTFSGRDGAGTLYSSRVAPNNWELSVTTQDLDNTKAAALRARFSALSSDLTFLAYDRLLPAPPSDPTGAVWSTATDPQIEDIVDRTTIDVSGFPNNYVIAAGTMIGVVWDTDRYYLGAFLDDVTTSEFGTILAARVTPALPEDITEGLAVNLYRPLAKFKIVPRSLQMSWSSGRTSRWSFKAESTYERTAT